MKKTKREYFTELKGYVGSNAELIEFINRELELLDKKNKAPKNPTAKQIENEKIKDILLANLKEPMTVTQMIEAFFSDYVTVEGKTMTNQKLSAIVTQLVEDNSLIKTVVKRVAYFSVI